MNNADAPEIQRQGFATLLRHRTEAVHREAERSGFIADLIRGRATRDGYALFLRNLLPVYDALEAALDERSGPKFAFWRDRKLSRRHRLRADLHNLIGADWAARCELLPEAERYAASIRTAASDEHLLAHAYARYLGDLSGGQILRTVLTRKLALAPDALAFYDFSDILDIDLKKAMIRDALDRVDPSGPMAEATIQEAIAAFRHNISLALAVQVADT